MSPCSMWRLQSISSSPSLDLALNQTTRQQPTSTYFYRRPFSWVALFFQTKLRSLNFLHNCRSQRPSAAQHPEDLCFPHFPSQRLASLLKTPHSSLPSWASACLWSFLSFPKVFVPLCLSDSGSQQASHIDPLNRSKTNCIGNPSPCGRLWADQYHQIPIIQHVCKSLKSHL